MYVAVLAYLKEKRVNPFNSQRQSVINGLFLFVTQISVSTFLRGYENSVNDPSVPRQRCVSVDR